MSILAKGRMSWSKNYSIYLDVKGKVFRKKDNKEFRLVQNLTRGEAEINHFMRLRNHLVIAAENSAREENLSAVLIPTLSKDMVEQFKLAHKGADVVDRANRRICVTLPRYRLDKPKSSYAQVRFFARKNEGERFQQIVYVNYKFEKFIYLLGVMISVFDKVITNNPIGNVLRNLQVFTLRVFPSNPFRLEH